MTSATVTHFSISAIRAALARHHPQRLDPEPGDRAAAVALVLAGEPELALSVIRRADRDDDPWSGHLALPGGRQDPTDRDARAAAERETQEEVGLELARAEYWGELSNVLVRFRAGQGRLILSPFVYYLGRELARLSTSEEVAAAFWVPLTEIWLPANASRFHWVRDGTRQSYPAVRIGDGVIWGLTFRVLTLFSDVLEAPLPHLEDTPGLGL